MGVGFLGLLKLFFRFLTKCALTVHALNYTVSLNYDLTISEIDLKIIYLSKNIL